MGTFIGRLLIHRSGNHRPVIPAATKFNKPPRDVKQNLDFLVLSRFSRLHALSNTSPGSNEMDPLVIVKESLSPALLGAEAVGRLAC
jgi:hypothetical protein